jgi:adenosylcobinamide-GDP ribazoletransferase
VRGFLGALAFLTRLPLPASYVHLERTVPWLPVVGALLGALLAVANLALNAIGASSLVTATVLVVFLLALTGALHADGLADTCDAVLSHASPERRLEIMRDPHVGAFGVVGVVCVIVLKIAAIDALSSSSRVQLLIAAPTLGRWAIVLLATLFPYGRTSGMGGDLKAGATPFHLAVATLVAVAVSATAGVVGLATAALTAIVTVAMGRWLMTLLPGLTGDTYGAACEVVETVVWLSAAPLARWGDA